MTSCSQDSHSLTQRHTFTPHLPRQLWRSDECAWLISVSSLQTPTFIFHSAQPSVSSYLLVRHPHMDRLQEAIMHDTHAHRHRSVKNATSYLQWSVFKKRGKWMMDKNVEVKEQAVVSHCDKRFNEVQWSSRSVAREENMVSLSGYEKEVNSREKSRQTEEHKAQCREQQLLRNKQHIRPKYLETQKPELVTSHFTSSVS